MADRRQTLALLTPGFADALSTLEWATEEPRVVVIPLDVADR